MAIQISRSEQKRRIKEVEQLVGALISLPLQAIDQLPYPEELKEIARDAKKLEGSARQRQIKYLTKLVQEQSLEPLYALVGQHRGKTLAEKKQLHTLEFYRDALINEALEQQQRCRQAGGEWEENWESETLAELKNSMPEIDALTLSRLAFLFARTRNPRYSREIFRYLRSLEEMRQRKQNRSSADDT